MEGFWEFVNKKPVRIILAIICAVFFAQGIYRVQLAQNDMQLFRAAGEILLFGGWMLANILRAYGKFARRLSIPINVGLIMVIVSIVMQWNDTSSLQQADTTEMTQPAKDVPDE